MTPAQLAALVAKHAPTRPEKCAVCLLPKDVQGVIEGLRRLPQPRRPSYEVIALIVLREYKIRLSKSGVRNHISGHRGRKKAS